VKQRIILSIPVTLMAFNLLSVEITVLPSWHSMTSPSVYNLDSELSLSFQNIDEAETRLSKFEFAFNASPSV